MRIDSPWGYLEFDEDGSNELLIVSTVEDPPKLRLASPAGLSLGAISFNRLRPDGKQDEMILLQGKQDERTRALPSSDKRSLMAEFTIHMNRGGDQDADMVRVCEVRHDGIVVDVPVNGRSL